MKKQNFFQRVFNTVKKSVSFLTLPNNSGFSGGLEDLFDSYNLRTFKESLYLFIGVSMIRDSVSSIPLQMYQIINTDGDTKEIFDDPFLDLLERPNNMQTQKEFWKLSIAYYLLAGEAFWYLQRETPGAVPTAMANMRPDHVRILISEDGMDIIGYEFTQSNGKILKIAKEDVLHIKNIDPLNSIRGIGVIRPASSRIVTEREASKHQANTFKNQGRPDVVILTEADITDEAIDDAQAKWQKKFGADKGSQLGIFGGGKMSMNVLGGGPKEMNFIETQKALRDDILATLHIPKAMFTSDDVNLANSKTARINYIKEAVEPILDTFIDVINNKFLNDMDQNRFVTYESSVNEDREILLKEATELKKAGIIKINEARDLMGYQADPEGDIFSPDNSLPTITMSMKYNKRKNYAKTLLKKRPILVKKFVAVKELTNLLQAEKSVKRSRNEVFANEDDKERYIKAFNKNIDNKAKVFKNTIDVYNKDFEKRILSHLEKFGMSVTSIFDVATEMQEASKIFKPLMQNIFNKSGQETLDNVASGFSTKASEQFHTTEDMIKKLDQRAEFFIGSMLNTDFDELKSIIAEAMANGDGVDVMGRKLREYFDNMSVARAKTIARTETGRLVSEATNEAYHQSAIVTGKVWLTANDSKVRDEHARNQDQGAIPTDGVFANGESYPGQSSINCRCALGPAV